MKKLKDKIKKALGIKGSKPNTDIDTKEVVSTKFGESVIEINRAEKVGKLFHQTTNQGRRGRNK